MNTDSRKPATSRIETHQSDNSRWPISFHRTPAVVHGTDIVEMLKRIDDSLKRRESHAIVWELDDEVEISAAHRKSLADGLNARESELVRYCRAFAIVARTAHARGVHTALRWLTPSVCPERTFDNPRDAENWAMGRVGGAIE
jgi:hypothetical protein